MNMSASGAAMNRAHHWSSLKHLRPGYGSPKLYRHRLDHPQPQSDAMLGGEILHAGVYEPEKFNDYVVMPKFHSSWGDAAARKNGFDGGKDAKAAWLEANEGRRAVPADIHANACNMIEAVLNDPHAGDIVRSGFFEQHIEWVDDRTFLPCAGTVDQVNGRVSELKSTRVMQSRAWNAEAWKRGYISQVAFYVDGLASNGVLFDHEPALIRVQNEPPYDVAVQYIGPAELQAGRDVYRECLQILQECQRTGRWPGVAPDVEGYEVPGWVTAVEAEKFTVGGVHAW